MQTITILEKAKRERDLIAIPSTLPKPIQKKFDKQPEFLLTNLQHPSLHAKKYNEADDI